MLIDINAKAMLIPSFQEASFLREGDGPGIRACVLNGRIFFNNFKFLCCNNFENRIV